MSAASPDDALKLEREMTESNLNRETANRIQRDCLGLGDRNPALKLQKDLVKLDRYTVHVRSTVFDRGEMDFMLGVADREGVDLDVYGVQFGPQNVIEFRFSSRWGTEDMHALSGEASAGEAGEARG